MTSKEFVAAESRVDDLKRIVNDPVFRQASETVFFESIPPVDNLGVASETVGAQLLQQLAGMKQFVRMLERLAEGQKEAARLPERKLYTEADRDRLKAEQQEQK